jgi:pyrrolysine biosynthesis protein PylD
MTRLTFADIDSIRYELAEYDAELIGKTGQSLFGLACYANGVAERHARIIVATSRLAVVPMTCGDGIISGFSETVAQIARHIGINATITGSTDTAGIAEAIENGSTHVLMADDKRFVALDLINRHVIDNAAATGWAFTAGLDLMARGLSGKNVLIIGCGLVGRTAAIKALSYRAMVTVCDINSDLCTRFANCLRLDTGKKILVTANLERVLRKHSLIIDATNACDIIDANNIFPDTFIAAPGMPLGLTTRARRLIWRRLLHDPLQLGVATMAVNAITASASSTDRNIACPPSDDVLN